MSFLAFFQPWMAVVGAAILIGAVVHKRRYFQPPRTLSLLRRIVLVSAIYFVPAALGWFFTVGVGLRVFADMGHPLSGGAASLCGAFGCLALGSLILGDELAEARKVPSRW